MITAAPTLTKTRLILRQPVPGDMDAYVAYAMSDRARFVGGPFDEAQAVARLGAMIAHWPLHGYGRYVMMQGERAIGHVGPLARDDDHPPEMTWTLWDGATEGQGLATEAAQAVTRHVFDDLRWPAMILRIESGNTASLRLAEKLGATLSDNPIPGWSADVLTYDLRAQVRA